MVASKSQQGVPSLTQEQMSKLTPGQQAQMRAHLLKAQDASAARPQQRPPPQLQEVMTKMKDPMYMTKFRTLVQEEEAKMAPSQTVQISPEVRARLQQLIHDKFEHLRKIEYAIRAFIVVYEGGQTEQLARDTIRYRATLLRNIDSQNGNLKDDLTMDENEFMANIRHILQFVTKIVHRIGYPGPQNNAAQQAQQQQQQQQQQPGSAQTPQPAQLNAANLKILEQQPRQSKPPAAPTTDRPPFQLGAQSPRGAPTYFEGAPKVENLRLPNKKKQRLDPQTTTPGAKPSPQNLPAKSSSPELKRQAAPEKPTFKCNSADCDYHIRGFDSAAELDAHVKDAHAKIDNPAEYAVESMADVLDVDAKTGQPRGGFKTAGRVAQSSATTRTQQPSIKPGQTPSVSQNVSTPAGQQTAATPMSRVPTQPGVKSSPSTNLLKTPQTGAKIATPSTGAPAKATPSSVSKPIAGQAEPALVTEAPKEPESQPFVPLSLFDYSYDHVYGALDTNAPFTLLDLKDEDTAWVLRDPSPSNTPDSSAKDTPSTRQSDISENDNLHIGIDMKDTDVPIPDAWMSAVNGDVLPLDAQLSEDIQTLGVTLPPMDQDDMMLFYGDNYLNDLDAMDAKMMESLGTLDPSMLSTA
jgi:hypothetical protein